MTGPFSTEMTWSPRTDVLVTVGAFFPGARPHARGGKAILGREATALSSLVPDLDLARVKAGSAEHAQIMDLRDRVLRKPLGRSLSAEDMRFDAAADLLVARSGPRIVGCCLLTRESPVIVQLRAMAVEPEWQRRGVGRALVTYAEQVAREAGAGEMQLEGRVAALGFYAALGFVAEGPEYLKVGIPHRLARKTLCPA